MIKKFDEYIKEGKEIYDILTRQEIDDQFLRLEEVFNCQITIQLIYPKGKLEEITNKGINKISNKKFGFTNPFSKQVYNISIFPEHDKIWSDKEETEVLTEINRIKRRMELEFSIKMTIDIKMPSFLSITIKRK